MIAALAAAVLLAAATPTPLQHVHGRIVSVDAPRGTFQLRHDPFAAMPMTMTMVVRAERPGDVKRLRRGAIIDATIDVNSDPWTATRIVLESETRH